MWDFLGEYAGWTDNEICNFIDVSSLLGLGPMVKARRLVRCLAEEGGRLSRHRIR